MDKIKKIKCTGCGQIRRWSGYECLDTCSCLTEERTQGDGEVSMDKKTDVVGEIFDFISECNKNHKYLSLEEKNEAKASLLKAIEGELPKLREQFLSQDNLKYQLGICEGRKQMLSEVRDVLRKLFQGEQNEKM